MKNLSPLQSVGIIILVILLLAWIGSNSSTPNPTTSSSSSQNTQQNQTSVTQGSTSKTYSQTDDKSLCSRFAQQYADDITRSAQQLDIPGSNGLYFVSSSSYVPSTDSCYALLHQQGQLMNNQYGLIQTDYYVIYISYLPFEKTKIETGNENLGPLYSELAECSIQTWKNIPGWSPTANCKYYGATLTGNPNATWLAQYSMSNAPTMAYQDFQSLMQKYSLSF